jgi:hypothetical protein
MELNSRGHGRTARMIRRGSNRKTAPLYGSSWAISASKRYYPPQTPCGRLLQAEITPIATKNMLHEIAAHLDPLKLLEEIRAVQAYLAALANGETPPPATADPPDLAAFIANLSSAWHAGEIRPTFSIQAKPRYLRSLQIPPRPATSQMLVLKPVTPPPTSAKMQEMPMPIYAEPGQARIQALRMVWPIACRRLEPDRKRYRNQVARQLND